MTADSGGDDLPHRARDEGKAWATRRIAELSAAGRPICGGWPGTMSEARHLAALRVGRTLAAADKEGFRRLSQTLYLSAKRHWQARSKIESREL